MIYTLLFISNLFIGNTRLKACTWFLCESDIGHSDVILKILVSLFWTFLVSTLFLVPLRLKNLFNLLQSKNKNKDTTHSLSLIVANWCSLFAPPSQQIFITAKYIEQSYVKKYGRKNFIQKQFQIFYFHLFPSFNWPRFHYGRDGR